MFAMIPRVVKTALARSGSTVSAPASASVTRVSASSVAVRSVSTLVSSASTTSARSTRATALSSSRLAFFGLLAASGFAVLSNMSSTTELSAAPSADATGLKPDAFTPFAVKSVTKYNHDSVVVTLALASPDAFLELPVSSFVMAKFTNAEGKDVVRPYTPLTATSKGELQLLVKVYANSQMGTHVANLKPGDTLALKGPMKKLQYVPNGKREVALVAGGSGITPMVQVMDKIASNPHDKTKVTLLFANKTPQDILLREQIDAIAKKHSNIKVVYFVDKAPFADGEVGHINAAKLKQYLPAPADDVMIYVCGPQPFYAAISGTKAPDYTQGELSGALLELGYTKDMVFKV